MRVVALVITGSENSQITLIITCDHWFSSYKIISEIHLFSEARIKLQLKSPLLLFYMH